MNQNKNKLPEGKALPAGALKCLSVSIPEKGDASYVFIMEDGEKKVFNLADIPNAESEGE